LYDEIMIYQKNVQHEYSFVKESSYLLARNQVDKEVKWYEELGLCTL